jgi:hypothetical protein
MSVKMSLEIGGKFMKKFSEKMREITIDGIEHQNTLLDTAKKYAYRFPGIPQSHLRLRLAFGQKVTSHVLTDGALEFIKRHPVEIVPEAKPMFIRQPFIVEARHNKNIYDNISAFAGFMEQNYFYLITVFGDDDFLTQSEFQVFETSKQGKIDAVPFYDDAKNVSGAPITVEQRRKMFSWIIALGIILEAERTPVLIEPVRAQKQRHNKKYFSNNYTSQWHEKRIIIDRRYVVELARFEKRYHELEKEGKILKDVKIAGHYRLQHFGENNKYLRYIFIAPFGSTRWMLDTHTRVILDTSTKNPLQKSLR